jgi:hypothetical protein
MRRTSVFIAAVFFFAAHSGTATQGPASAPQEIRLWPGKAPGTETWTVAETATTSPTGDRTIANVSDPSVTAFLPSPAVATGAAVVVAPGGALRALAWDSEGVKVAQWLNSKGIAALLLKYRTLQNSGGGVRGRGAPPQGLGNPGGARVELEIRYANANPEPGDAALAEVLRMGTLDAQQALRLARRNAAEWRIDPTRVGIMGFPRAVVSRLAPFWQNARRHRRTFSCPSTAPRCRTSLCPRMLYHCSLPSVLRTSMWCTAERCKQSSQVWSATARHAWWILRRSAVRGTP